MRGLLLPMGLAALVLSFNAFATNSVHSKLNCTSLSGSVSILEEYSIGVDGYFVRTAALSVRDKVRNEPAAVAANSQGLNGSATTFILGVRGTRVLVTIPARTFLSFETEVVQGQLQVDNGPEEVAKCTTVKPEA